MFKRATYSANHKEEDTPFRRARQIWDDRIGGAVAQARNWRRAAVILACACLCLTGGIVYTATTIRVYPYVIEVAETGQVRTVGKLVNPTYVIPDKVKEYLAQDWIERCRGLSLDSVVVKQNLDRCWTFTGDRVRAMIRTHIEAMAKNARLPERDIRRRAIIVNVLSVLPVTTNTYRVDWTEQMFNAFGKPETETPQKWAATLTLKEFQWSASEDITKQRDQYPLGVYLYDLHWSPIAD